ncbi:hypothetical protein HPP92_011740 [Vanilla planifolia]|uniref:Uncharacterized protein n=1 Tax=Vanilla planifolia TaxID=51239 RepID=A0A835R7M9_VANPL|nr:hypothetical protein HPP92_011740 [Vanilla planifolia]
MVRKIYIYTKEEVQKMNPGTLNPRTEGNSPLLLDDMDVDNVHQAKTALDSNNLPFGLCRLRQFGISGK